MSPRRRNRLLIAPQIVVVEIAIAALIGLDHALLREHPLATGPPHTGHDPDHRLAEEVLRHSRKLRRSLRSYRHFVEQMIGQIELDEALF